MKKILFSFYLFILISTVVTAQNNEDFFANFLRPQLIERLNLTEPEIEKINEIVTERQSILREAQLELNIYKAELERILFDVDPDLSLIRENIEQAMVWKIEVELANISIRIKLRKILGEQRWQTLLQLQSRAAEQTRN